MFKCETILCAVDLSDPSRLALEAAADLARRYGAKLTVLHVDESPPRDPAVLLSPPELFVARGRHCEPELERWRAEAQVLAGAPVESLLLYGAARDVIVRTAGERRFDLAVVATHGRTGLKHVVLGSVAETVVRTAPCAVFVVRRPGP